MAKIEQTIEIDAAPETVYERLSRFDDYPGFVQDVRQLRRIGASRLQCETGYGEHARSFEIEITQQIPGVRLAWRMMQSPHYQAHVALQALETEFGPDRTRLTLTVDSAPGEQVLAGHDDPTVTLRERMAGDLARFKKQVERHDPSGVHMAASRTAHPGGKPAAWRTAGGADAEQSASAAGPEATAGSYRHSETDARAAGAGAAGYGVEYGAAAPEESRMHPWMRHAPALPDLRNLWQQPLRIMRSVSRDMGRLFEGTQSRTGQQQDAGPVQGGWSPLVETARREQKFIVCAELPGVRRDDLQVEIKHDRLTIEGERRPEPRHEAPEERRSERNYGHFYRVIALPPGAQPEAASAALHDGVLEVTVPLAEFANRPRRLDVRAG